MKHYIRDLTYGVSGAGKTTWWLQVAQHLYATKGLRTRWYLGDGGGQTLVVAGVDDFVDIMHYNLWDHPIEVMARIAEGWWPRDPLTPNSPLMPTSQDEFTRYGLFVYEGTSVGADYIMGDREGGLANRMAKGESLNNDISFKLADGALKFGGNARTHYGFTQNRIRSVIEATRALPVHVGWTGHERKAEDEDVRETWIGPDVAGKALTTKIGAAFGNTIHLQPVKVTRKIKDATTQKMIESVTIERRAYTRTHYDPEATHFVRYYANTRIPSLVYKHNPDFVPEWIEPDAIAYYQLLERATIKGKALLAESTPATLNL